MCIRDRVFPVEEGIDFLGYVIRPDYVRLRKRIKQKTAYEMRISDWSSDVCSSDLIMWYGKTESFKQVIIYQSDYG